MKGCLKHLVAVVVILGMLADGALGGEVSCQRLGLRVSRVELDAAVKDVVWLPGQVVSGQYKRVW